MFVTSLRQLPTKTKRGVWNDGEKKRTSFRGNCGCPVPFSNAEIVCLDIFKADDKWFCVIPN